MINVYRSVGLRFGCIHAMLYRDIYMTCYIQIFMHVIIYRYIHDVLFFRYMHDVLFTYIYMACYIQRYTWHVIYRTICTWHAICSCLHDVIYKYIHDVFCTDIIYYLWVHKAEDTVRWRDNSSVLMLKDKTDHLKDNVHWQFKDSLRSCLVHEFKLTSLFHFTISFRILKRAKKNKNTVDSFYPEWAVELLISQTRKEVTSQCEILTFF